MEWIIYETTGKKETYKNSSCNIDQLPVSQMDRLIYILYFQQKFVINEGKKGFKSPKYSGNEISINKIYI